jgi:hypothetical protein
MRVSELTEEQKRHLAWRLDHKTTMGLLAACRYARGEGGDLEVVELFRRGGRTDRSAKIHATKVRNYGTGYAVITDRGTSFADQIRRWSNEAAK